MVKECKKVKLLKPKYDVVFQALFKENKDNITESFISDILGEKVEIIDIKTDDTLSRRYPNEKTARLDLRTKLKDGSICQVEMQLLDQGNTIKRILYYWGRSYTEQIERGDDYKELNKTIGIIITDYEIEELKEINELDTKWKIMDTKKGQHILTNDLELHIIELPKAKKILDKEFNNRIAQWMAFLDNPNTERVERIMKDNKEVKKANNVLHVMSEDEELKRLAELKERYERDRISAENTWKERGLAAGRKEGIEQGRKEGIEQGIKEGEKSKAIEIAKKMKDKDILLEEIIDITGLTKEEIEKI